MWSGLRGEALKITTTATDAYPVLTAEAAFDTSVTIPAATVTTYDDVTQFALKPELRESFQTEAAIQPEPTPVLVAAEAADVFTAPTAPTEPSEPTADTLPFPVDAVVLTARPARWSLLVFLLGAAVGGTATFIFTRR